MCEWGEIFEEFFHDANINNIKGRITCSIVLIDYDLLFHSTMIINMKTIHMYQRTFG